MTPLGAYIVLAVFPVFGVFWQEPVAASWGYKHGRLKIPVPPLPPQLKERSERNYRYLLFLQYGLLCTCIYFLMRRYSVPTATVGLHLQHWLRFFGLGVAAGVSYLIYMTAVRWGSRRLFGRATPSGPPEWLSRGSASLWVLSDIVSCFVEEYWRAFCLLSLVGIGHGHLFAVVATSVAFSLAHYRAGPTAFEFGRLSSQAIFGVLFALLFLWCRSIVPTFTGHLVVNLIALYRARAQLRRKLRTGAAAGHGADAEMDESVSGGRCMVTCPLCGGWLGPENLKPGTFRCPGCKQLLQSRKLGGPGTLVLALASGLLAFLIPRWAGVHGNALLIAWFLLVIPISIGCGAILGFFFSLFFPKLERADDERTYIILPPGSSSSSGPSSSP